MEEVFVLEMGMTKKKRNLPPLCLSHFFSVPYPPLMSTLKNGPMMTIIKKNGYIYDSILYYFPTDRRCCTNYSFTLSLFWGVWGGPGGGLQGQIGRGVRFCYICGTETRGYTNISSLSVDRGCVWGARSTKQGERGGWERIEMAACTLFKNTHCSSIIYFLHPQHNLDPWPGAPPSPFYRDNAPSLHGVRRVKEWKENAPTCFSPFFSNWCFNFF